MEQEIIVRRFALAVPCAGDKAADTVVSERVIRNVANPVVSEMIAQWTAETDEFIFGVDCHHGIARRKPNPDHWQ